MVWTSYVSYIYGVLDVCDSLQQVGVHRVNSTRLWLMYIITVVNVYDNFGHNILGRL